jgi:hypothetical protein
LWPLSSYLTPVLQNKRIAMEEERIKVAENVKKQFHKRDLTTANSDVIS